MSTIRAVFTTLRQLTHRWSRHACVLTGAAFALCAVQSVSAQQTDPAADTAEQAAPGINRSHAIAMHGEPKYPADFTHFDYVNPDAPVGGRITSGRQGSFDSFNQFIPKGESASTGSVETLTTSSEDEPFTQYGLLAETIEWPDDRSWVAFEINPKARWHDGQPVTADDVIWTFNTLLEKGPPGYRYYYAGVEQAIKESDLRVKFTFKETGNLELPLIVGQLPVFPQHYWQDKDFSATTLDPPLGSGPYRVKKFEAARYITLERVPDYWGKDLPINIGRNNFDEIQVKYYRDTTAIRLALKGGELDYFAENQAKAWSVDYDTPAVNKGWMVKKLFDTKTPEGMQAFVMNTRRPMFQDPKVRRALGFAFDFEWTNKQLFYGLYTRTYSFWSNSEMAARGLPEGEELEILQEYKGRIPAKVFTNEFNPPVTDGSGWSRDNLKKAAALLEDAGWEVRDLKLVNSQTGEPFDFEILLVSQAFERIVLPFTRNLARLGITARVRLVDNSQYFNRLRSFDFDVVITGWGQSESPGNEQRGYWSSDAADSPSSRNLIGIKNPVIDELVEKLILSPTRESLVARTRALDRVLLWNYYVIPNWHLPAQRMVFWDKFGLPAINTKNGTNTNLWWLDETKAQSLEKAMGEDTSITETDETNTQSSSLLFNLGLLALGVLAIGWIIMRRRRVTPESIV